MRYHLTTFGCQMNAHDSERMKGLLERLGYREAARRDDADLILFNTCTIRGSADERFIGNLGDAKRVKRLRPDAVVAVGGCWAQSQKEEVFRQFQPADELVRAQARLFLRRSQDALADRFERRLSVGVPALRRRIVVPRAVDLEDEPLP